MSHPLSEPLRELSRATHFDAAAQAADALDQLQTEVESARTRGDVVVTSRDGIAAAITRQDDEGRILSTIWEANPEVLALAADAERYRTIRRALQWTLEGGPKGGILTVHFKTPIALISDRHELDAAVDAATIANRRNT